MQKYIKSIMFPGESIRSTYIYITLLLQEVQFKHLVNLLKKRNNIVANCYGYDLITEIRTMSPIL